MSTDSKHTTTNDGAKNDDNSSAESSEEHINKNAPTVLEKSNTSSRKNSPKNSGTSSPKNSGTSSPKNSEGNSLKNSRSDSLKKRQLNPPETSSLHSSKTSEEKQSPTTTNKIITERPLSPVTPHRIIKQQNPPLTNKQRNRSQSPRKTFSYLALDRSNIRKWKQQSNLIAKQQEDDRIYYENRQKLERLAKIASEPSAYPMIHIEQERHRERHAIEHQRKVLKGYIPILKDNLCIVGRLANVKGVYDIKRMDADFKRHAHILKQDAANRQKARETAAQRPFILPKINIKS